MGWGWECGSVWSVERLSKKEKKKDEKLMNIDNSVVMTRGRGGRGGGEGKKIAFSKFCGSF